MALLPFLHPKKQGEIAAVFDIGSSSVGGAVFALQESGAPKVLFSVREPIPLDAEFEYEKFLASTMKVLDEVMQKTAASGAGAPRRIHCVLGSPWFSSETRVVKLAKDEPFVFNAKLADSLIQKETEAFEEAQKAKREEAGAAVRPIEFKSMRTVLNGYPSANPLGQRAKTLEMTIFIAVTPEDIAARIEEMEFKYFHSRSAKFTSFTMAAFAVARDMFVHQDNFLLVDLGGEVTDISMIKKDTLEVSASFPLGTNFIIRGLSRAMKCGLDEARSLVSLYKDGHAALATEKTLEPAVGALKAEWLRHFQESLATLSNDISIPATIFITIERDMAGFFSEIIKTEQFNQYTLTESKFRVIFLGPEALHGIAEFAEDAARDPFVIIESIYINRFLR